MFENGTELAADVVIFATGWVEFNFYSNVTGLIIQIDSVGDLRDQIRIIVGDELVSRCKPIWGLNSEGEIQGAWRNFGVPNMWYMMGQFSPFSFGFRNDNDLFICL